MSAGAAGDRGALSYLWARYADDVWTIVVAAGADEAEALAITTSAFGPAAVDECRGRRDVAQCLADRARALDRA